MPTTAAGWSYFVQRLQDYINYTSSAAGRTHVNSVPSAYTVYNGTSLPTLTTSGCTVALDSSHAQFGNASLLLTATASTVSVQFYGYPVPIQAFQRWIDSVYLMTSRSSIAGTLTVTTANATYSVNIGTGTTPGTWTRLYGTQDLTADAATACTLGLTLTGCSVGDTFNIEAWQFESASGSTNLPSPWVNTNPILTNNIPGSVKTFQTGTAVVNVSTTGQVNTLITLPTAVDALKCIVSVSTNSQTASDDAPNTLGSLASNTQLQLVTDKSTTTSSFNVNVFWQVLEWY